MTLHRIVALLLILPAVSLAGGQTGSPILTERFSTYDNGSDGHPHWSPANGFWILRDGSYRQETDEYDCVSFAASPLQTSFSAEIVFRHESGEPGAGMIFSSSGADGARFAHLGRFDGTNTFITGYYIGGEYTTVASTPTDSIRPGVEHTLRLSVDRTRREYSFWLDGKPLLQHQELLYASGFLGLQSSGGTVAFRSVTVATGTPDSDGRVFDHVTRFALLPDYSIALPDHVNGTVAILDSSGNLMRSIGRSAMKGGVFSHLTDVASYQDSLLIVADSGSNRIHVLSRASGKILLTAGGEGTSNGQFRQPVALISDRRGLIYVVDRRNNRVQIFDGRLRPLKSFGSDRLRLPSDIAVGDSAVYVLNAGLCQIEEYMVAGTSPVWKRSLSYGGGMAGGIALSGGCIYVSVVQEVRRYDPEFTSYVSFSARASGFMAPRKVVPIAGNRLYIADCLYGRLIVSDTSLREPTPVITQDNRGTHVTMDLQPGETGSLLLDSTVLPMQSRSAVATRYEASLPPSSTTRHLSTSPVLRTIPQVRRFSKPLPVPPDRVSGRSPYARMPIVALLFANVIGSGASGTTTEHRAELPSSEIDRVRAQIADGVRFYWIHSGFRLYLDVDVVEVRDPVMRSEVYGSEWWYPPRESTLSACLHANGRDIRSYAGALYLTFSQLYDSTAGDFQLSGKGGGFTSGVGTGKGYGISWWDVTRDRHNAGNNWLMVHEFNHQLDDIFSASGYPEYWFNHISPTIGTAARFGEHFDANAYILHIVPRDEWLDLKFTTLHTSGDADDDGIPDSDSSLPLDEKRLGSDPRLPDTDGDGLPDLDEVLRSNWIIEGWGETAGKQVFLPDLTTRDTDNDGIPDGVDPVPCADISPNIHRSDSKEAADHDHVLGLIRNGSNDATLRAFWTPQELSFRITLRKPVPLKLMIDGNDDGWFLGRDNILLTLTPKEDTAINQKVQLFNATDPDQWPVMDTRLADSLRVMSGIERSGDSILITVKIGRSVTCGIDLTDNEQLGLLFGVQSVPSLPGSRFTTLFEPNRFFTVHLK
jgi:hypothetical protein